MNATNRKGFALLLLGLIFGLGMAIEAVVLWYIGLALGIIGTIMVFLDKESDEK